MDSGNENKNNTGVDADAIRKKREDEVLEREMKKQKKGSPPGKLKQGKLMGFFGKKA